MNNFFKNVLLLVASLFLSYLMADYFGVWYDFFSPQYGGSWFGFSKSAAIFIAGLPVAYVFFSTILFSLLGFGNKKKWLFWLLSPALLLWLYADIRFIYLPITVGLVAFALAIVFKKVIHTLPRSDLGKN